MNDEQIAAAAVAGASDSTGDFVAGARWAIGEADAIRNQLWATIYAQAHAQKVTWWEAEKQANDAVFAYDRRK